MNRQSGFTLIELVVVIVILGILAVTAAPKFIDIQDDARQAAAEGVLGSVKSAAATAYGKALVTNNTGASGTITVQGTSVTLDYGYPDVAGIVAMVELDGDWRTTTAEAAATFTSIPSSDSSAAGCSFTYAPPTAVDTPPVYGAISCQ